MKTSCPLGAADTEEIRRAFQGGRMDVLFNLVDDGKISIDQAAEFAGLTMEEAEDAVRLAGSTGNVRKGVRLRQDSVFCEK